MGCLKVAAEHERFIGVAFFHPLDTFVCHQVGGEAFFFCAVSSFGIIFPVFGCFENRVNVFSLVVKHAEGVEAGGLCLEVPFTEKGCLIAACLHLFGNIILVAVEAVFQCSYTVEVTVGTCQDGGATGSRDGIGAKAVVQHASFIGKAFDIVVLYIRSQYTSVNTP